MSGEALRAILVKGREGFARLRINRRQDAINNGIIDALLRGRTPSNVGYLYLTGVSADGELFTINDRAYELDPAGVAAVGDVAITVANGADEPTTAAAIVAGVNADALRDVDAVLLTPVVGAPPTSNCIAFIPRVDVGDSSAYAFTTTMGNAIASDAQFNGGSTPTDYAHCCGRYVVTAQDQDVGGHPADDSAGFPIGGWPHLVQPDYFMVQLRDANGVVKVLEGVTFTWVQVNSGFWVLECIDNTGGAPRLAATDVLHWEARAL